LTAMASGEKSESIVAGSTGSGKGEDLDAASFVGDGRIIVVAVVDVVKNGIEGSTVVVLE
jgi:hypothetical protein